MPAGRRVAPAFGGMTHLWWVYGADVARGVEVRADTMAEACATAELIDGSLCGVERLELIARYRRSVAIGAKRC